MSDISLNAKLLMGLYRFYVEKQGELPLFFGNDISEFSPAYTGDDIPRGKRKVDITELDKLADYFFRERDINLSGFGMLWDGKLVKEYYKTPFSKNYRRVSYSVCKTVISLGIGIAIDKGLLSVDTKLSDIFPEHNKIFMKKGMKQVAVKHLLTMTAGVYFDELSAFFSYDWRKDFMGSDVLFPPGKEFYYNSLNSYMLGACISRVSGVGLMDFLKKNLFDTMDIRDITWDKCPMGLPRGGWGMKLSLRDMLKFGELIINNGKWMGKDGISQLVSREYMDEMLTSQVDIKDKKLVNGYGYGIWLLKDGGYLLNGIFGQNVYINREKNIVIATCGSANELFPDGELVERIMDFAKSDFYRRKIHIFSGAKPDNLRNTLKENRFYGNRKRFETKGRTLKIIKGLLGTHMGADYRFEEYASGILPLMTQVMYSDFLLGIDSMNFSVSGDEFYVKLKDRDIEIKLKIGYSQLRPYEYQLINVKGKELPVAVGAGVISDDEGRNFLRIHIVFLEEVSDKVFKIYFDKDSIRLKAFETPDLIGFMNKFMGDDRLFRIKKLKKIVSPDYVKYKIEKILQPNVVGYIDD